MTYYEIIVGNGEREGWTVRLYGESDEHLHSAENVPLNVGLAEVKDAILREVVERYNQKAAITSDDTPYT